MPPTTTQEKQREKRRLQKTLTLLCLGFFFVLTVYNGIEPLQSSMNSDEGLGTTTTGLLYTTAVVSSLFVATPVINHLGPKRGILALFLAHTLYCLANFHPSWWTLVPASSMVGLMAAVGWGGQGVYMVSLATSYAELTNQEVDTVISFFNGIFFVFIGLTRPVGNLISSVILRKVVHNHDEDTINESNATMGFCNQSQLTGNQSINQSLDQTINIQFCGANHCPYVVSHRQMLLQPDRTMIYALMGVYLACNITGVAITATLPALNNLKSTPKTSLFKKCRDVLSLLKDYRLVLLILPYLATGMVRAMNVGSFTQSFVSCILGTGMVGYSMMCDGFGYALFSLISGRLTKYIPRVFHIVTVACVNIIIAVIWLLWEPTHEAPWILFALAFVQGSTNGVWTVQTYALTGLTFTDSRAAAGYAHVMLWGCLGHAFVFGYNNVLCFSVKTYVFIGVVVGALVTYLILELVSRTKKREKSDNAEDGEAESMNVDIKETVK